MRLLPHGVRRSWRSALVAGFTTAGLVVPGCHGSSPAPPFAYGDGGFDGTIRIPGPKPDGSADASADGASGFDAGDSGAFDGGTPRCTVTLTSDLLDDANATGAGFDLAARVSDFVVAFAYLDLALTPPSNVFARVVTADGTLGVVNSYLDTDQAIANPALVALESSAGAKSGDLELAWEQSFFVLGGQTEIDLVGVGLDAQLSATTLPAQITETDATDERFPAGAPLPSNTSRLVFASRPSSGGSATMQTVFLSTGVPTPPADVNASLAIVGAPAIASTSAGDIAVFHGSNGGILTSSMTTNTIGATQVVGTSSLGTVVAIDGDDTGAAAVFEDEASTGRPTVRFVALGPTGLATAGAVEVTPSPVVASAPAIAILGSSRLVVYRGIVGGTSALRAALLDATGQVLSDQPITGASATGRVRVRAVSTDTALAVFEEPATSGTSSAPGYRVRAAVLVCPP